MKASRRAGSPVSTSKLVLHEGINCLVFDADGDVTPGFGRGLYFDNVRQLSRWQLRLDDRPVQELGAQVTEPNVSVCFVTNPKLDHARRETLGIVRTRILDGGVREEIAITNYGDDEARFELSLTFGADYLDISEVESSYEEGRPSEEDARVEPLKDGRGLLLAKERKGNELATRIAFDQQAKIKKNTACFSVEIRPGERYCLYTELSPIAISHRGGSRILDIGKNEPARIRARREVESRIRSTMATLETDHAALGAAYQRAVRDLASLAMTQIEGVSVEGRTIAAGVPWYTMLFGRDALTAARLTLLADPDLALGTLRVLGALQGTKCDETSREQPGKILHAYRRNLAQGETRRVAKFKTLDATPLYLLTACEYARHRGDAGLIEELWPTIVRAVEWIENYGDCDGDGLLEHDSRSGGGWKDSSDAVRYRDGRIGKPTIALVEIQGYALRALSALADICERLGRDGLVQRMRSRVAIIHRRLLSDYWMNERRFFAQALDGDKRQVDGLTSNPGHLLWVRAIPDEYAGDVARMLTSDVFFSGWGIRTRASCEGGFNPVSYHNGSVWPHDNAIIASGFAAYGYTAEARKVLEGMLAATAHWEDARPPEVFAGYPKDPWNTPVAYFGANPLQAWASASIVEMVRTVLGLEVDAFNRRLSVRPFALSEMSFLAWRGVQVGGARIDVETRFEAGEARTVVRGLPDGWHVEGGESQQGFPERSAEMH